VRRTDLTFFEAVISSIASLKRRPKPDVISHPSVGTESQIQARQESKAKLESLRLTQDHLEPLVMSLDEMQSLGYVTEIPSGSGGEKPSEEDGVMKCDRCAVMFQVKGKDKAEQCEYHWGRPYSTKING
jgi:RNA exonuclease 1